jgi:hypothetical protein
MVRRAKSKEKNIPGFKTHLRLEPVIVPVIFLADVVAVVSVHCVGSHSCFVPVVLVVLVAVNNHYYTKNRVKKGKEKDTWGSRRMRLEPPCVIVAHGVVLGGSRWVVGRGLW